MGKCLAKQKFQEADQSDHVPGLELRANADLRAQADHHEPIEQDHVPGLELRASADLRAQVRYLPGSIEAEDEKEGGTAQETGEGAKKAEEEKEGGTAQETGERAKKADEDEHLVKETAEVAKKAEEDEHLVEGSKKTLTNYFLQDYMKGGVFKHDGPDEYVEEEFQNIKVLRHKQSNIRVWSDVFDLRRNASDPSVIVYHYTTEVGFANITHRSKEAAEIWASLNSDLKTKEGFAQANAWYGKGVYGTSKSPSDFPSWQAIVDNNFRRMAERDGPAKYEERVKYCLPLLVTESDAYDVNIRETPEMVEYGYGPGKNIQGQSLNEEGKTKRDQWVVRVENEGTITNAKARIEKTMRERRQKIHERFRPDSEEAVDIDEVFGRLLRERGNYKEAEPILRSVMEARRRTLGPEHANSLSALNNYALTLSQMGRLKDAEPLEKKVLELRRKALGEEHPSTLTALLNYATTVSKMGRHSEAEPLRKKCLELHRKALGPQHPDTMLALGNYAATLMHLGRYSDAEPLQKENLENSRKTLGPEHPSTLIALHNYVFTLAVVGRTNEVEMMAKECFELERKVLGPQHPHTSIMRKKYAEILRKVGRHGEARALEASE